MEMRRVTVEELTTYLRELGIKEEGIEAIVDSFPLNSQRWRMMEQLKKGLKRELDTKKSSVDGLVNGGETILFERGDRSRLLSESRRYLDAVTSGDEKTAGELLDKKATEKGYIPVKMYYGRNSAKVDTSINNDNGIVWVTEDLSYADRYADGYFGEDVLAEQLFTEKNSGVYELYAKRDKVLELGDIDQELNSMEKIEEFVAKVGISKKDFWTCWNESQESKKGHQIWIITNTKHFADIIRKQGYDTMAATEADGIRTYGILYPQNVKSAKTVTYDENGEIIPLEKRFDDSTNDVRYSFAIPTPTREDADTTPQLERRQGRNGKGDSLSSFADNVERSSWIDKDLKERILSEEGIVSYNRIANADTLSEALDKLENGGASETSRLTNLAHNKKSEVNETDVAELFILLEQYQAKGDYESAHRVVQELSELGRRAGRTVQIFSILGRMTPEGMTMYAHRTLDEAFEKYTKNKSKKTTEKLRSKFELTDEEVDFIRLKMEQAG